MTRAEKRRNLYTSSSKYRNWPRLGLWAVGLRSLGLAGLGVGLWDKNSVLNILGPTTVQTYLLPLTLTLTLIQPVWPTEHIGPHPNAIRVCQELPPLLPPK